MVIYDKVIDEYFSRLTWYLERFSHVPEFLHDKKGELSFRREAEARLLCQTRGILFLLKKYEASGDASLIHMANTLYWYVRKGSEYADYFEKKPCYHGGSCYEFSFLLCAQSTLYLYCNTSFKHQLAKDIFNTLSALEDMRISGRMFSPIQGSGFWEQNSAMHAFEALTCSHKAGLVNERPVIDFLEEVFERFFDTDRKLVAETVSYDGDYKSYQMGHNFEWVSLLSSLGFNDKAKEVREIIYESADYYLDKNKSGVIVNDYDAKMMAHKSIPQRIWPSLEYIRSCMLVGEGTKGLDYSNILASVFFTDSGLYKEYEDDTQLLCKSTTGYHLIETYNALNRHNTL